MFGRLLKKIYIIYHPDDINLFTERLFWSIAIRTNSEVIFFGPHYFVFMWYILQFLPASFLPYLVGMLLWFILSLEQDCHVNNESTSMFMFKCVDGACVSDGVGFIKN